MNWDAVFVIERYYQPLLERNDIVSNLFGVIVNSELMLRHFRV